MMSMLELKGPSGLEGQQPEQVRLGELLHGMNNVLHAIMGRAELARECRDDPAFVETSLREIQHAAERGREMVRLFRMGRNGIG